jgi:hypothetical protein
VALTLPEDVRALLVDNRPFRRLFAGSVVSSVGDALYTVAATWLVWSLTGSTVATGAAGVATRAPQTLQALVGPVVDRAPLRRVLVGSELVQLVVVLVVPVAAALDVLSAWAVVATMAALELANQFSNPAAVAAIPRLVDEDRLVRANSLGNVAGQASRAAANAAAGVLLATVGAVALYLVDAATFAVAAVLMLGVRASALRVRDGDAPVDDGDGAEADSRAAPDGGEADSESDEPSDGSGWLARYRSDLTAGLRLVWASTLRHLLTASLLAGFLGGLTVAVLPAYADLLAGAAVYGALVAARNGGAFVGSVVAPAVEERRFGLVAAGGFVVAGGAWLAGVGAGRPAVTAALFGVAAVVPGVYNVLVGAVLQTGVPADRLGRVRAVVGSAQGIVVPLGLAVGGLAGETLPVRWVVTGTGVGYLLVAAYYLAVPALRRFPPATEVAPGRFDDAA